MTLAEFLDRLTSIIEEAGIAYMLTGSLAAAYYAEPRATRDVDLVIAVSPGQAEELANRLDRDGLYVSLEAAREAVRTEGQFNAIDPASGWKADLIPRKGRRFSREEFSRRRRVEVLGRELPLVTAEDLIVAKLEWSQRGASERQLRDALGILAQRGEELDREHIERWVDELDLDREWERLVEEYDAREAE